MFPETTPYPTVNPSIEHDDWSTPSAHVTLCPFVQEIRQPKPKQKSFEHQQSASDVNLWPNWIQKHNLFIFLIQGASQKSSSFKRTVRRKSTCRNCLYKVAYPTKCLKIGTFSFTAKTERFFFFLLPLPSSSSRSFETVNLGHNKKVAFALVTAFSSTSPAISCQGKKSLYNGFSIEKNIRYKMFLSWKKVDCSCNVCPAESVSHVLGLGHREWTWWPIQGQGPSSAYRLGFLKPWQI